MCGIVGYFGKGNSENLKEMTRELAHRGPDDEGFFNLGQVGLGQRRLSIIDLSPHGHQPMSNEDETLWISFNGEIYNFKELRKSFKKKHEFKSETDTEIILHLYEEIGTEVFKKLNGMFALAIYDKKKNKIILARDRMGKKPLYYGVFNKTLIFASELKALLRHPECKKEIDLNSLNKYLQYEYVPTPHSIFKNIYKLEPASFLEFNGKEVKKNKFWKIEFNLKHQSLDLKLAVQKMDGIIEGAVKKRLLSDVPLGVFLSGGLDSSAICYYAQKNTKEKIKTFSIGFKESSFDESKYARQVAEHLKTDHHEKILSAKDSLNLIPKIAELLDEPMADASILPTYLLSEFTRENVTVALGGDGGDELFCGYDTFVAHKLARLYEKIPLNLRKNLIEKIALKLPTSHKNMSFDFKVKSFISDFYGERKYRNQRWLGAFNREERANLLNPDLWKELETRNEFEDIDNYLTEQHENNYYNSFIYLYLRMYMMDDILVKVDRASMYNSLEVRTPLLDYNVVDFADSLPMNMKMKGFKQKYILKKLMEGRLPKEIIYRKKKGFGIPLAEWILGDLKPLVLEKFSKDYLEKQGLFNFNYIDKLLNEHFSRQKDNRKKIWTLLIFQLWWERWGR